MTDHIDTAAERDDLVAYLRKTPGWPRLGNTAADQIERDGREIEGLSAENQRLRDALSECLGALTGGMDGTWAADSDPIAMARAALPETKEASHDQ